MTDILSVTTAYLEPGHPLYLAPANPPVPTCGKPFYLGSRWICTREFLHEGPHAYHDVFDHQVVTWDSAEPPTEKEKPPMKPAYIQGPLDEVLELASLQPPLLEILRQVLSLWPVSTAFLTSALRTPEEDAAVGGSGLHVLGRAVDLRTRDLPGGHSGIYPIDDEINRLWIYDPQRPYKVVAYVAPHGTGPHLHLQVHPNTRRREA